MLFDFKCEDCNKVEEHWVASDCRQVRCKVCDGTANRMISGVMTILDPMSGDFPGSTLKWARHHEQMAKRNTE